MNQRERLLAIVVGLLAVVIGGWMISSYVGGQFRQRRQQIETLESQIATAQRQVQAGKMARKTITEFEERSLTANPEVARSLYHDWLLAQIGKVGLTEQDVRAVGSIAEKDLYVQQSFQINAKGTLPQIVDFLHDFYAVESLHRVSILKLKPVADSKLLDLDMKIDALSLMGAATELKPPQRSLERLKLGERAAYQTAILGRNLFGPANQAPRLTVNGSRDGNPNRQIELTARATDADSLDKVRYELVEAATKDARFDAISGRLTWTPRATGKYEFRFRAQDDGLPSKTSDLVSVVVNVADPPPVQPSPPARLAFDQAKFTILTAVLEIGGTPEVWLHVRPTGETLKLHAGDPFEIGSVKGVVEEIGESHFVFLMDDKLRRLEKGDVLEQSQSSPQSADSRKSTTAETAEKESAAP